MLRKSKGFTLIELLVVISIIALLLSILMPALTRVKSKARSIVCRSNLKQMSQAMVMYSVENDGKTMAVEWYPGVPVGKYWFFQLRPYLGLKSGDQYDPELELAVGLCPSAKTQQNPNPQALLAGTAKSHWRWQGTEGSYGLNLWTTVYIINAAGNVHNPPPSLGVYWGSRLEAIPSRVPFLGDANWVGNMPLDSDEGPYSGSSDEYNIDDGPDPFKGNQNSNMGRYCLDRHNMAVNIGFIDGHVEGLPLKELWQMKWHKTFKFSEMEIRRP